MKSSFDKQCYSKSWKVLGTHGEERDPELSLEKNKKQKTTTTKKNKKQKQAGSYFSESRAIRALSKVSFPGPWERPEVGLTNPAGPAGSKHSGAWGTVLCDLSSSGAPAMLHEKEIIEMLFHYLENLSFSRKPMKT